MDLTWSRRRGRLPGRGPAWLEAAPRRLARRPRRRGRHRVGRHPGRLRPAPRLGAAPPRRPLGRRVVARAPRRPRRVAVGVADLRGGVLPGRRPAAGHPERHLPAGADALRVRHARAAGPRPAPHGGGRGPVVPGLVRAQRGQRPGRHPGPGHAGRRAAGGSTARRRGPPAAPSAPTCSACSAPTRTPSGTGGSPTSSSRSTRPGSPCGASGGSTATRASPRCSSTTPSWPTTRAGGWCSARWARAGRWRWPPPGRSGA